MRLLAVLPVLALALLAPAAAHAAYAPKLAVKIDPATPQAPTALTTVVTQASGETPSKTVRLPIPAGWQPASNPELQSCTDEQKASRACPEPSRMGTATAKADLGTFTGTVNYGPVGPEGIRFFIFLSNGFPLLDQTIEGRIEVTATGFATVLDGLPDVAVQEFTLALAGPPRSLLATPMECGESVFEAEFTSHKDEKVTSSAPVEIGPCPNQPPVLEIISATKSRVTIALDEPAAVELQVKRGKKVVATKRAAAAAGRTAIKLPKLKPGRYRIVVRAADPEGARSLASDAVTVKKPRKRSRRR
jgi:uncharacterized protein (DUF2141 family)